VVRNLGSTISIKRLQKVTRDLTVILKKVLGQTKDEKLQQTFKQFDSAVRAFLKKNA
jgi:hypothetical protein